MEMVFTSSAHKDYFYWKRHDPRKARRIEVLCKALQEKPFDGIGKPEPLKFDLEGCWSRRIDRTHRLVYRVDEQGITIISCRHHY